MRLRPGGDRPVDPETATVETYCDSVAGGPLPAPNWNLFAADGTMYVSDSCDEPAGLGYLERKSGRVVAIPAGGGEGAVVPTPPLDYPNGMALAPDRTLYVVETFLEPRIVAMRDGTVTVVRELPRSVPDGLALDDEGGLLVSMFQPNLIVRIPPGGGGARDRRRRLDGPATPDSDQHRLLRRGGAFPRDRLALRVEPLRGGRSLARTAAPLPPDHNNA